MTLFVSGDQHFGHSAIIRLCERKIVGSDGKLRLFKDVDEMDEIMIQRWNERVKPRDTVYHLGDFNYKSKPEKYFHRLNGAQKFLIAGNHDSGATLKLPWTHVYGKKGEYVSLKIQIDGQNVIVSHFAGRVWDGSCHGVWMLFGHSHDGLSPSGFSFDVGVDGHNYYPWSGDEIKEKMKSLDYKNHPEANILKEKFK